MATMVASVPSAVAGLHRQRVRLRGLVVESAYHRDLAGRRVDSEGAIRVAAADRLGDFVLPVSGSASETLRTTSPDGASHRTHEARRLSAVRFLLQSPYAGNGTPGRTRTADTRFRKPLLYPLSYRGIPPVLTAQVSLNPTAFSRLACHHGGLHRLRTLERLPRSSPCPHHRRLTLANA